MNKFKIGDIVVRTSDTIPLPLFYIDCVNKILGSTISLENYWSKGTQFSYEMFRFATPREIEWFNKNGAGILPEDPNKELSADELVAEATKRYPIGTLYKSATNPSATFTPKVQASFKYNGSYITDGYGGSVYKDGVWADIVLHKEKSLLEQAKEKYKTGMIIICQSTGYFSSGKEVVIYNHSSIVEHYGLVYLLKPGRTELFGSDSWMAVLYTNKKWAPIITKDESSPSCTKPKETKETNDILRKSSLLEEARRKYKEGVVLKDFGIVIEKLPIIKYDEFYGDHIYYYYGNFANSNQILLYSPYEGWTPTYNVEDKISFSTIQTIVKQKEINPDYLYYQEPILIGNNKQINKLTVV